MHRHQHHPIITASHSTTLPSATPLITDAGMPQSIQANPLQKPVKLSTSQAPPIRNPPPSPSSLHRRIPNPVAKIKISTPVGLRNTHRTHRKPQIHLWPMLGNSASHCQDTSESSCASLSLAEREAIYYAVKAKTGYSCSFCEGELFCSFGGIEGTYWTGKRIRRGSESVKTHPKIEIGASQLMYNTKKRIFRKGR